MLMQREIVSIGMGEMKVAKDRVVTLSCIGLGSCIGLCAYDPINKVGAMAHMVLPESSLGQAQSLSKYVNTGIPWLLQEIVKQGAVRSRLIVKAAGGARMFTIPGSHDMLDVGARNIDMTNRVLKKEGISLAASDVGGSKGRTMSLALDTGKVTVKTVGGENVEL